VKIRISNLLPILLMLFLAGLTLWLRITMETPGGGGKGHDRHDPDAIVDKLELTRLNEQGSPMYLLSAARMVHFADDDTTELASPHLRRPSEKGDVTITAERGTATRGGEEVFLHDNVQVVRAAAADREELRIHTDYLHVLTEKNIALTDHAVTITEGQSMLSGVGMEYDDNTRRLALHSKVKGSFVQTRK
jgi:lipopolysaccharide export system protein LptC